MPSLVSTPFLEPQPSLPLPLRPPPPLQGRTGREEPYCWSCRHPLPARAGPVVMPRVQETWGPKLKITGKGGGWSHCDIPCPTCGSLESGDVKATVAVLSFILSSAAKHSVDSDSLSSELQQLGLPRGMQGGQAGGKPVGRASRRVH